MSGSHTHSDSGGGGAVLAVLIGVAVVVVAITPIVMALIHALLVIVLTLIGVAAALAAGAVALLAGTRGGREWAAGRWQQINTPPSIYGQLPPSQQRAIEQAGGNHVHFHGLTAEQVAEAIRQSRRPE